jgi:hypothetical protein
VHTITKILIVLNLLICLVLSQYVWISLAGNAAWKNRYEAQREQRHRYKSELEAAFAELASVRATGREDATRHSESIASINATKMSLQAWLQEAEQSRQDAERNANDLIAATGDFNRIVTDYNSHIVDSLQRAVTDLSERRSRLYQDRGNELRRVAQAYNTYAEKNEQFRRLEYHLFLLQEEYERRADTQARYRWLRPDIQRDLGDSGPVIFAEVTWAHGRSLQINKGRRDGVQLHQKYTIMRNGSTIAVVDVVDVQNETAECIVTDLVAAGMEPRQGDEAVTRLFMARLGR